MKKYITMLLMVLCLMGCINMEMDTKNFNVNTLCIDGVTYIYIKEWSGNKGFGYMSVKLDTNSKIVPCEVTEDVVK